MATEGKEGLFEGGFLGKERGIRYEGVDIQPVHSLIRKHDETDQEKAFDLPAGVPNIALPISLDVGGGPSDKNAAFFVGVILMLVGLMTAILHPDPIVKFGAIVVTIAGIGFWLASYPSS
jgi:hypothetical protein